MHMGPIKRDIKAGDVLDWDKATKFLSINGNQVMQAPGVNLEEAVNILDRQRTQLIATGPWSKELPDVQVDMGNLEVFTGTQVVLPILGCLKAAEEFLSGDVPFQGKWIPGNEDQYQFLKRFESYKVLVTELGDTLRRKADKDINVINAWLKENGFDIELQPETEKHFAVASILDVLVEWVNTGDVTVIYNDRGSFPAVSIKKPVKYLDKSKYPFPIVMLETKSGDEVYMTVADYVSNETFGLTDKVDELRKIVSETSPATCDVVVFPMVNYNSIVDISWIQGLANSDDWYVGQAIQQTKFRMNEIGARAQSAVAMTFRKCCVSHEDIVHIDKPFILWIRRPGVPIPLFAGVFGEDVWKKPKNLNEV
jgi:hypothetical protein